MRYLQPWGNELPDLPPSWLLLLLRSTTLGLQKVSRGQRAAGGHASNCASAELHRREPAADGCGGERRGAETAGTFEWFDVSLSLLVVSVRVRACACVSSVAASV